VGAPPGKTRKMVNHHKRGGLAAMGRYARRPAMRGGREIGLRAGPGNDQEKGLPSNGREFAK